MACIVNVAHFNEDDNISPKRLNIQLFSIFLSLLAQNLFLSLNTKLKMPDGFVVAYVLRKIKKLPCLNFMWFLELLNFKNY